MLVGLFPGVSGCGPLFTAEFQNIKIGLLDDCKFFIHITKSKPKIPVCNISVSACFKDICLIRAFNCLLLELVKRTLLMTFK